MFKIGEFSRVCRVPVSALRYYADIGLLQPSHTDPFTGYRYYSAAQLPRLNRILALKELGLSLEQITAMLNDALSADEIRGMLRLKKAEMQQQVAEQQARLDRLEARLRLIEQEGKMPEQEVVLKPIEALHVMAIRETIGTPEQVGALMGECFGALMPAGIQITGAPMSIYYDEEFKPDNLDVEIAFPTARGTADRVSLGGGRAITAHELPAVETAACIIHKGDYQLLGNTYAAVARWIEENGYRIVGPPREVYLTAPGDPAGLLTEIQYPVTRA